MSGQGDIVYEIGGEVDGLVAAGQDGARSLKDLEKQSRSLSKEIDRIGKVAVGFQRQVNGWVGVNERVSKSAKESAKAFAEWEKSRASIDSLRASIDPLFAASMRYENALQQLDLALDKGSISADYHAQMVKKVTAAYLTVDAGPLEVVGRKSLLAGQNAKMFAMQLSQVGQQSMVTGNFVQALAIQLPDMGLAFGGVGAMAGLLAGVALPALMTAFGNTADQASTMQTALDDLDKIQSGITESQDILKMSLGELIEKYGLYALQVRDAAAALLDLQIAQAQVKLDEGISSASEEMRKYAARMDAAAASAEYLAALDWASQGIAVDLSAQVTATAQSIENLIRDLNVSRDEAIRLADAFALVRDAASFEDRLAALRNLNGLIQQIGVDLRTLPEGLRQALIEAGQLNIKMGEVSGSAGVLSTRAREALAAISALAGSAPGAGWLAGAIGDAKSLVGTLWEAARAKAAALDEGGMTTGSTTWWYGQTVDDILPPEPGFAPANGGGNRGGGGGGGANQYAQRIETIVNSLKTERELIEEWYQESLALLQGANDAELEVLGGKYAAIERLEAEHQERLAGIQGAGAEGRLGQAANFYSQLADATQAGHGVLGRIHKAAQIAEAISSAKASAIAAWEHGMKTGGPGLALQYAALSAVKTASMISGLIGSGGGGGGGAGAGGAAAVAAPAAPSPTTVNIRWVGDMSFESFGSLTKRLNEENKMGYRLNLVMG
jgi:hypothetical protein